MAKQGKADMSVNVVIKNADGSNFWDYRMRYYDLPPEYVVEVGSACQGYASYIENLQGTVGSEEGPGYTVSFDYEVAGLTLPTPFEKTGKGKATASRLSFSQMTKAQEDGAVMQQRLLNGARLEIASGQRS